LPFKKTKNMKKLFFAVLCAVLFIYVISCNKSTPGSSTCIGPSAVSDSTPLLAFAKKYGITPTVDTSKLYYEIINPGSGASPSATSKIFVRYAGRLMDGTYFDSTAATLRFAMDSLIKGWQYGLPKIKSGGRIKLLIPSALAFGCQGAAGVVPPNSPLYFDIYLDSLK
jgi:FKBP-type peptidyl-prolyl cis-trans isomerase FkpA